MTIANLDHVNINAPRTVIEECRTFYVEVLGMYEGERPPFRSEGYWLYAGGQPLVHLTVAAMRPIVSSGRTPDHVAFACEDFDATVATLRAKGVTFRVTEVPLTGQRQVFLQDPAGVGIELGFR
jgi:glyoxylase I family protein